MANWNKRKNFLYWIFPLILITLLIIANYSGLSWLQNIIAPKINRELGLLEHLQLVCILVTAYYFLQLFKQDAVWWRKLGFLLAFLFSLLLFFEEVDYGLHYYEYFAGEQITSEIEVRNIHNQGDNNYYIRQVSYIIMILLFVLLPLFGSRSNFKYLHFISGDRLLIATFLVYLYSGQLARALPKWGFPNNPSLFGNHQEFEELIAYFMILLFVRGLKSRMHLL